MDTKQKILACIFSIIIIGCVIYSVWYLNKNLHINEITNTVSVI